MLDPAHELPPRRRNWFERNWKWLVPLAFVGVVVTVLVFVGSIVFFVLSLMKSSWACSEGLALARSDQRVVAALGEPIEVGWFVTGNVFTTGGSGEADLSIPLRGPDGTARLYVVAHKMDGEWHFASARVAIKGRAERIDLLEERAILQASFRGKTRGKRIRVMLSVGDSSMEITDADTHDANQACRACSRLDVVAGLPGCGSGTRSPAVME